MDQVKHAEVEGTGDAPSGDLRQRLTQATETGTPAERALAHYLLANLPSLPFETAATVAGKVGVSEASVGRFCRSIGYRHLKDLKSSLQLDLGEKAWLIGDRLKDFHRRSQQGSGELARALEHEIAAVVTVYELAATPAFQAAVHRLARRRAVWVAGFQTERGHAAELVHNMQYLRAGVHLADIAGGHFAEVLLSDPAETTLVLIDGRRYSRLTRDLALAARDEGIPVTLITDPYCDWGPGVVTELFAVPTDLNHFWDTTSAMSSLIGLMVNGVFRDLGAEVEGRMARVSELYGDFIGHTAPGRNPGRP
ncbi:MurR/RpiR family transcriptional regulator [Tabrizicola sp.]|jgi:DNA-binding MurR/RpiR family transcriptional regulator|uniref:MurR/RpiR family transcriptional regulator n=1 Tax=Tabrizicola sp. TaxID=2005166 RepID=UPI001A383B1E|nr:MurR/RpiR family transcriptional regulator [Tabrizicola sp.]MBL9063066.1 MurR/RpiR family transcriptional regulator [Tabrizicola sp.]